MSGYTPDEIRLVEQAADWLVALEEEEEQREPQFAAWVGESARNIEEFLFVSCVREEMGAFLRRHPLDIDTLVAEACAEDGRNIIPLGAVPVSATTSRPIPRRWLAAACLTALLIALAGGATVYSHWHDYTTGTGEQRTLGLPDGSIVHMNTESHIKVDYRTTRREIHLLAGEALFRVATDPARPFRVHAGGTLIQALGTQFNVYCRDGDAGGATVSVIEGAVRISRSDSAPPLGAGALTSGQQARVPAQGDLAVQGSIDVASIGAWRQRRLVFVDEPLAEVAAEFNRYNAEPRIEVRGAAAAATLLSGVFDADDPEALLLFVSGIHSLSLERTGHRIIIRSTGAS